MSDLQTMIWKEWREMLQSSNRRSLISSMLVALLLLGVILPLQQGNTWHNGGAIAIWAIAPVFLLTHTIADTIAGERERHTLETLLASHLSNRAILFGKILLPTLWSWSFIQFAMLVALIPVSFASTGFRFYGPDILLIGMVLSALTSLLVASVGVLFSLRAPSVRQAQQYIGLLTLGLLFLPIGFILLLTALPEHILMIVTNTLEQGNFLPVFVFIICVLGSVDFGLLWLADQRFQRSRLILD